MWFTLRFKLRIPIKINGCANDRQIWILEEDYFAEIEFWFRCEFDKSWWNKLRQNEVWQWCDLWFSKKWIPSKTIFWQIKNQKIIKLTCTNQVENVIEMFDFDLPLDCHFRVKSFKAKGLKYTFSTSSNLLYVAWVHSKSWPTFNVCKSKSAFQSWHI